MVFRADRAVLSELVPEPFELASDEVTAGTTDHYQPGHGLPVRGGGLPLRVRYQGLEGRYDIVSVTTSDETMCANREELGRGMILGDVRLRAKGNTFWGEARRAGRPLFRLSVFPEKLIAPDAVAMWGSRGPLLCYKKIPSADPDRKPWRQIMAIHSERQGGVVEQSVGRGSIEICPSVWGTHRIEPIEVLRGTFAHFEGGELKKLECLWEDRPLPVP